MADSEILENLVLGISLLFEVLKWNKGYHEFLQPKNTWSTIVSLRVYPYLHKYMASKSEQFWWLFKNTIIVKIKRSSRVNRLLKVTKNDPCRVTNVLLWCSTRYLFIGKSSRDTHKEATVYQVLLKPDNVKESWKGKWGSDVTAGQNKKVKMRFWGVRCGMRTCYSV